MIGRTLGHYRIDAKLGEGGMGKPLELHLPIEMAIKCGRMIGVSDEAIERVRKLGEQGVAEVDLDTLSFVGFWPDQAHGRLWESGPAIDIHHEDRVDSGASAGQSSKP